jgi:predicted ferric reductase
MKILLGSLLAIVSLAWGMDVLATGGSSGGTLPWVIRQEALYLSGLLSIALMSLAMFLSTRPAWLETPLGGMDRVYRTHKWAGILACELRRRALAGRGGGRETFSKRWSAAKAAYPRSNSPASWK